MPGEAVIALEVRFSGAVPGAQSKRELEKQT
jgi:hypothetical protein